MMKRIIKLCMKMYRITVYTLILGIVASCCSCVNATKPTLKLQYQKIFEEDTVDFVVPFGSEGIICSLNSNEMLVLSNDGTEIMRESYSSEIVDIDGAFATPRRITVALSDNEVITYEFKSEAVSVKYNRLFDHRVVAVSSVDLFTDMELVLLETGDLYGYGENYKSILSEDEEEDVLIETPLLIACDVTDLSEFAYVTEDGICYRIPFGVVADSLPSDEVELYSYCRCPMVCTEDTAYSLTIDTAEWEQEANIDSGFVSTYDMCILYRHNGIWYYTGNLSARPVGKGTPVAENEKVKLPEGYSYQVAYAGIIGYDEHTVIIYSV